MSVEFWKGEFGDEYTERNVNLEKNNLRFFDNSLLFCASFVHSIVEFGAGSGQNIKALRQLFPHATIAACEINQKAIAELKKIEHTLVYDMPIGESQLSGFDLAISKGLLIHIPPHELPRAYEALYTASCKYILIAEYYNPTPVELYYRGNTGKMWKRDFAGEFMGKYPDVQLIDYGFVYRRDKHPQDDITYFLMEKKSH